MNKFGLQMSEVISDQACRALLLPVKLNMATVGNFNSRLETRVFGTVQINIRDFFMQTTVTTLEFSLWLCSLWLNTAIFQIKDENKNREIIIPLLYCLLYYHLW